MEPTIALASVLLGAFLTHLLHLVRSWYREKREGRRLRSALSATDAALQGALQQKDWKSPLVDSHVTNLINLLRERDLIIALRAPKVRLELMDLHGTLAWFIEVQRRLSLGLDQETAHIDPIVAWRLSSFSPLSMRDKFHTAREYFQSVAELAESGDVAALQQLQPIARAFLEVSREYTAGGAARTEFNRVISHLERVHTQVPSIAFQRLLQHIRVSAALLSK